MVILTASSFQPTLSTLSALPSPTSLQVAAVAYSLYNGTRLVRNGCAQGDGSKNCTAACQNMTQVFTSMDTFQNCLAFPTINNILSTANTTNEYRELAREYGITGEDPNSSFGVVNQITSCLASYCSDSSKCYAFGQQPYQAVGSDMSCSYLQDLNRFPISLLYFPYDRHILFESCDANAATVYIGDDGRSAWYGKESNGRQAYCDTSSTINGTSTPRARLNIYNGTLACIQSICGGVHQAATVDSEIGGIGIYISYFLQAGIALIAWSILIFWNSGLYYFSFLKNLRSHGRRGAMQVAQKTQHEYSEHQQTIIEGLIEFHKAQCFFMLAIQFAALAAKHGSFLERSSLQQIYNNSIFIDVLATGGYLPITFVLYALWMVGHRSIYILFLSGCTIIVSAAALLTRESIPEPVWTNSTYPKCGNVSPTAFCAGSNYQDSDFGFDYILSSGAKYHYETPSFSLSVYPLVYSSVIFLLLLLDHCNVRGLDRSHRISTYMSQDEWLLNEQPWIKTLTTAFTLFKTSLKPIGSSISEVYLSCEPTALRQTREQPTRSNSSKANNKLQSDLAPMLSLWRAGLGSPRRLKSRLLELSNLAVLGLFIYFMVLYINALTIFRKTANKPGWVNVVGIPVDLSNWTFGQLVAITVWVPPLIQYAYLELHGMQGRRWHLPKGYEVVSAKPKEHASNDISSPAKGQLLPSSARNSIHSTS